MRWSWRRAATRTCTTCRPTRRAATSPPSGAPTSVVPRSRTPHQIPEQERDYYLERLYPSYGNLAPRDVASRRAKEVCDEGRGVGPGGHGVYLDFRDAIARLGRQVIAERYGNLFEMYQRITGEDPFQVP